MSSEQENKAVVERLYEAFRTGDVAALEGVLAIDFINHNPTANNGLEASQALFAQVGVVAADVYRMIAEGDLVALHAHVKTPADTASMDFFKVRDGKIVEHWDVIQDLPEHTASGQDMFSELS